MRNTTFYTLFILMLLSDASFAQQNELFSIPNECSANISNSVFQDPKNSDLLVPLFRMCTQKNGVMIQNQSEVRFITSRNQESMSHFFFYSTEIVNNELLLTYSPDITDLVKGRLCVLKQNHSYHYFDKYKSQRFNLKLSEPQTHDFKTFSYILSKNTTLKILGAFTSRVDQKVIFLLESTNFWEKISPPRYAFYADDLNCQN